MGQLTKKVPGHLVGYRRDLVQEWASGIGRALHSCIVENNAKDQVTQLPKTTGKIGLNQG